MNNWIFKGFAGASLVLCFLAAVKTCVVSVRKDLAPWVEMPQAGPTVAPKLLAIGGPSPQESPLPTEAAAVQERPSQARAAFFDNFVAVLPAGEWQRYVLGPSAFDGGYVVDVTPLERSVDGAHVEHKVLPEFDGEQWNDVLWMILPEPASPLRVRVRVFATSTWPVVFQARLALPPGEWQGHIVRPSAEDGGYVIEINPLEPGQPGDTVEKTLVQPEYFMETWYDVLRVQIPAAQETLEAEVRVYRTPPDLPVAVEYDAHLPPGDWQGFGVGPSRLNTAYVIEVTPVDFGPRDEPKGFISRFTVQPEFNGQTWNDAARLMVEPGWPVSADAHVRVYAVDH